MQGLLSEIVSHRAAWFADKWQMRLGGLPTFPNVNFVAALRYLGGLDSLYLVSQVPPCGDLQRGRGGYRQAGRIWPEVTRLCFMHGGAIFVIEKGYGIGTHSI